MLPPVHTLSRWYNEHQSPGVLTPKSVLPSISLSLPPSPPPPAPHLFLFFLCTLPRPVCVCVSLSFTAEVTQGTGPGTQETCFLSCRLPGPPHWAVTSCLPQANPRGPSSWQGPHFPLVGLGWLVGGRGGIGEWRGCGVRTFFSFGLSLNISSIPIC